MLSLSTPIESLAKVGPKNLPRLKRLGIRTLFDLLRHFPSRYEDYSRILKIDELKEIGQVVTLQGEIERISSVKLWKRRMTITEAVLSDGSGQMRIVWFNQPYIETSLPAGSQVSLSGKLSLDKKGLYLSSPVYERFRVSRELTHTGKLVAVYPETDGITSKYLRFLISGVLDKITLPEETLPESILEKYSFPSIASAIRQIHLPKSLEEARRARNRFAFEELLLFQLRNLIDRRNLKASKGPQISFDQKLIADFVKKLPFELTDDQRLAAFEILKDMEKGRPMNRLLNGDVGSGKTVVALIAAYQAAKAGYQTVFMAPTEILAKQHYQTICEIVGRHDSGLEVGLLTSSAKNKKEVLKGLAAGRIKIIVGTHALIQEGVTFTNLALVIVDEQHRFGIEQRMKLTKGRDVLPHFLSMTATPIPRTLALTIYGDLDVSLIKQKPKNRLEVITKLVAPTDRKQCQEFIDSEIQRGRQVFVICPRIEISQSSKDGEDSKTGPLSANKLIWAEVKVVTREFEKISKEIFPHRRASMLHGKMKTKEKDKIMRDFKNGQSDILVATSVVEVGVDVANATIMIIESAERFGLAQLHQFRGRVGRGQHQSYCFLFTSSEEKPMGRRLKALEKTNNGFELAEMDLKIRGPGEFGGLKQSGLPDLAMSSLSDVELIKKARFEAKLILQDGQAAKKFPRLFKNLSEMRTTVHFE